MAVGLTVCVRASVSNHLCPEKHSCLSNNTLDGSVHGCSCDYTCKRHGDCCQDSEHYDKHEQRNNIQDYLCVGDIGKEVYMKGNCMKDWNDTEIQTLCLQGTEVNDPRSGLPFTDNNTNITYVNAYCVICNGETPDSLRIWLANTTCSAVPEKYKSIPRDQFKTVFRNDSWGFIPLGIENAELIPCEFTAVLPSDIESSTSPCTPTINTCNSSMSWQEHEITLCQSGNAAAVHVGDVRFRNRHCASCNGYTQYSCVGTSDLQPKTNASAHPSLPFNATITDENCPRIMYDKDEYIVQDNRTVYIPLKKLTFIEGEFEFAHGGMLVCLPEETSQKFSFALGWVGVSGLALSCLAMILHLVAFSMVATLRNMIGKCLASLCISLLAAYTAFLLNFTETQEPVLCTIIASAMYYFFLCSFAWMTTIAFDVWYTFRLTQKELRVAGGEKNHRFLLCSAVSWLAPAVCLAAMLILDQLQPFAIPENYLPGLGGKYCWFSHRKSLLVFFATPMAILTLVNVVFFTLTAVIIFNMSKNIASSAAMAGSKKRKKTYISFLRLAVLMGLTWTSGIVAGALDLVWVWYIFVILNSLQGVFIFIAFTCRNKVLAEVRRKGRKMRQWLYPRIPGINHTSIKLHQKNSDTSGKENSCNDIETPT